MAKSNLAFLTALYNAKDADFYTDIYFPIVKYAAVELFYLSSEKEYYEVMSLQETIKGKTGITIPLLVLKNCIRSFSKSYHKDVSLVLYEDGNYFKIERAWNSFENTNIENQTDKVAQQFRELELLFKNYLEVEKLDCNYSFVDFFTEYAEEAYAFIFQNEQLKTIDEEYVNLVRFINYVKENKRDVYQIICELMWGSIISGFLQRPRNEVGTKYVESVEYYLDTAIVLNILGLNTDDNVSYARDLIRIIKESGGVPKIHPITLQEIKQIFGQVELSQGPKPGSAIQIAWERDNLTPSYIIHLKNNLLTILNRNYGVSSLNLQQNELEKSILRYKQNPLVHKLAIQWNSVNEDYFREIHDVYMYDYVSKLNGDSDLIEKKKAYFVTLNMDVLNLHKEKNQVSCVIHPGKVVMSLWIHGSRSVDIKKSVLVEVMSRCFAMNQTDARHKINSFNRHYKDKDLTEEDMQSMYTSLIRRSTNTINKFDELEENENSDNYDENLSAQFAKAIVVLVKEEREAFRASAIEQTQQLEKLNVSMEELRKQLAETKQTAQSQEYSINNYAKKSAEKDALIKTLQEELEKKKAIEEINTKIEENKSKLSVLNKERQGAISYTKFWVVIIIESIGLLLFLLFGALFIVQKAKYNNIDWINGFSITSIVGLVTLLLRCKDLYILDPKVKMFQIQEEKLKIWDNSHPEFKKLQDDITTLENKKQSLGGYLTK